MDITKNCQTVICDQKIQTWIVYSSNFYPHNSFNFIRYSDRLSVFFWSWTERVRDWLQN